MANGWTKERGLRQSQPIKTWKSWKSSIGPKTEAGKARASRNADQGLEWPELRAFAHFTESPKNAERENFEQIE